MLKILRCSLCTIPSQAPASPAIQRRTSSATTWASSNQHSPELLVSARSVHLRRHSKPQHHNIDTLLWSQKFRTSDKARHFSRTDGWGEELTNRLGWFASPNAPWLWTPRGVMQALKFFEAVEPVPRINAVYARVKPAPRASFQQYVLRHTGLKRAHIRELRKRMHGGHLFALGPE